MSEKVRFAAQSSDKIGEKLSYVFSTQSQNNHYDLRIVCSCLESQRLFTTL